MKAKSMAQRVSFLVVPCSIGALGFLLCIFYLSFKSIEFGSPQCGPVLSSPPLHQGEKLRVYIADIPREFNYGLLQNYWSKKDSRASDDQQIHHMRSTWMKEEYPPYPDNPLIKQYSADYWLLGDLLSPPEVKGKDAVAQRVWNPQEAHVIFVPFFATLSAEMQLDRGKAKFRKKSQENEDYLRQRRVVDLVKSSTAWQRSGGRDHVFVLTGTELK